MSKKIYLLLIIGIFALNCAPTKHTRIKEKNSQFNNRSEKSFAWDNDNDHEIYYSNGDSNSYYFKEDKITKNKTSNYNGSLKESTGKKNQENIRKPISKQASFTDQTKNKKKQVNIRVSPKKKNISFTYYKVKKGDTLLKISKKFSVSVNEIKKYNNIKSSKIFSGMSLKIPLMTSSDSISNYNINNGYPHKNNKKPDFCWPLSDVYSAERDGLDGVKPIGIIITGKSRTYVISSADGIVTKIGYMRGFGNYIIVKHVNMYLTIYSYLQEVKVSEGDTIKKGKRIGYLEGNKLHFQIGYAGKPADPLIYLSKKS